jgi:hypothetical protein
MKPNPVVNWVTANGVPSNPPTLHIAAFRHSSRFTQSLQAIVSFFFSFNFDMCLANEVKLDTLKVQLHGQVRVRVMFHSNLNHNHDISASKYGSKRRWLRSGNFYTLAKSRFRFGCPCVCSLIWLGMFAHATHRYKNEKTDPELFMDSDPEDDDQVGSADSNQDPLSTVSSAELARNYHKANPKKPTPKASSKSFSFKWDVILLLYSWSLVVLCPYTKVEESFNMQAMHDIMFHQHNIEAYDHLVFTGPVPRTLLGSVIVSTASSPITIVLSLLNAPNWAFAYAARMVLASFLVASVSFLRFSVHQKYDSNKSWWLGFVNLMQFHIPFYISRSLPNTFALFFMNMALGCILRQHYRYATALLTASAVIFRSDTLVFAAPFVLSMLISKKVTFFHFLLSGFATAIPCILISVAVDSFFWRRLLWPEALVFLFNTVQNKSAEWGTLPWNW